MKMRFAGFLARKGKGKDTHGRIGLKNTKRRESLEDFGVNGGVMLYRIYRNVAGEAWSGFIWLNVWRNGGLL
jgi:hypothetical protein